MTGHASVSRACQAAGAMPGGRQGAGETPTRAARTRRRPGPPGPGHAAPDLAVPDEARKEGGAPQALSAMEIFTVLPATSVRLMTKLGSTFGRLTMKDMRTVSKPRVESKAISLM